MNKTMSGAKNGTERAEKSDATKFATVAQAICFVNNVRHRKTDILVRPSHVRHRFTTFRELRSPRFQQKKIADQVAVMEFGPTAAPSGEQDCRLIMAKTILILQLLTLTF